MRRETHSATDRRLPGAVSSLPAVCRRWPAATTPFRLPQRRKPAISGAMNEPLHPALLPLGLRDLLPPDAAAEALAGLGIAGLSVDLTLPRLVPALYESLGLAAAQVEAIRGALDHKDAAKLAAIGGTAAPLLGKLLAAAGPAGTALAALAPLALPPAASAERARLVEVVTLL